jgi:FkbM family methyltransferase
MTIIETTDKGYFDDFFKGIERNHVFVDVGAFNGDTIDIALKYNPDIKIIAIEPIKSLYESIKTKYASNPGIQAVNKAAWGSKCTAEFNEYEGWAIGLSTLKLEMLKLRPEPEFTPHISKYQVECNTLDNILASTGIETVDYIKIDTECSEEEVLSGFTKYHAGTRFHIEFHITNLANILQRLLEMNACIETVAMRRDSNIKSHVVGTIVGHFTDLGHCRGESSIKTTISKDTKDLPLLGQEQGLDRRQWILQQIKPGEKVLDIGCADGWVFKGTSFVPDVTSIDLDLYDIPNFIRMDASNLKFEDNKFDVAVLGEILEHVDDPVRVLKEAKRVVRRIIITVPDEANWAKEYYPYELPEETARRRGLTLEQVVKVSNPNAKEFYQDNFKHLFHGRHYTEPTLRQDLEKAGITYEMKRLQYNGWSFFVVNAETANHNWKPPLSYSNWSGNIQITTGAIPDNVKTINYEQKPVFNKDKLRVALISTPFFTVPPSGYSGLEQIVWDLAEALDELGHEVTIYAPDGSRATEHGHVVHTGPSINTVNVNWFEEEKRMYNIYKELITPDKFDIVHGHNWFAFEFLLKMSNPKLNVVHTHHGGYSWQTLPLLENVNLAAISKFMKGYTDNYFKQKGFNNFNCTAVYNGVDMRKYYVSDSVNKTGRLLFVGRLDTFKKPDLAIEVALKLNIGLDLVGGTFVQNEAFLNKIRSLCDGTQIILHENATHEKKIELMQSAKCLLFTSQMGEPFGLVNIEAMACGLPVVAVNDGATEEIVQEGGILCEVFEKKLTVRGWEIALKLNPIDALAEAVGRIDKVTPQQARHNAEKFDRKIMAENYLKLYKNIMAGI